MSLYNVHMDPIQTTNAKWSACRRSVTDQWSVYRSSVTQQTNGLFTDAVAALHICDRTAYFALNHNFSWLTAFKYQALSSHVDCDIVKLCISDTPKSNTSIDITSQ